MNHLIQSQDEFLKGLRKNWLGSPFPQKKMWIDKIDQALDVRLQMMSERDK